MEQYNVTGMSCAACQARVEKAVSKVPGVESCSVSLLTNSMGVEGTAPTDVIIKAVEAAGYGASVKGAKNSSPSMQEQEDALADKTTPVLKKRLTASVIFLIVLMYFSMGHMMWGWPLPSVLEGNHVAMGLIQMLLTIIIMVINQHFFISGFKGLLHRSPNMDTLVALGSGAAFVWSTYALFAMTAAQVNGDMDAVMSYMHEFYFESAAMILALITVGKMLEAHSKGKTTDALKSLMQLAPKTATVVRDGVEQEISVDAVKKGDIFVVRPGENIPVDGEIIDGTTAVNESALTGESIPVDKQPKDAVSAATVNQSGFIKCRATRVGEDTTLSQIIQMVSDAAATKAPIAKIADRVSGVFVPAVITIAIITIIAWLIAGETVGFSLARGISVLVISCPCALGLATPVAIMVGNGKGAKSGILFKTAASLEATGRTQIVALDKTGTITSGEPKVTDIVPDETFFEKTGKHDGECQRKADDLKPYSSTDKALWSRKLLAIAASVEAKSEHPLAKAIMERAKTDEIAVAEVTDFSAVVGNGLTAILAGKMIKAGNLAFVSKFVKVSDDMRAKAVEFSKEGKTPLFFAADDRLCGIIAVADTIKEDSPEAVRQLKNMGIRVVMLTGDNEQTANAIGKQAGVDEVIAGVLPDGKEAVLMKSRLIDVPAAVRLSRATLTNIHENLFWAFFYNVIGIPLAAGLWYPLLGWKLNPMFGAAAMSLSSFCVVTNALRLNLCRVYDPKHDRKATSDRKNKTNKPSESEEKSMTKTMNIEGMMCGHCEARVKKALEALDAVSEAAVSHESGTAVVTLSSDISDEKLKETVEAEDYKVTSIQ